MLDHVTIHRVVRQAETQLVFEVRDGAGVRRVWRGDANGQPDAGPAVVRP